MEHAQRPSFREACGTLARQVGAMRLLAVVALGTLGYGTADVLLEPYGGQVLGLSVADTTKLTALLATGTLLGFGLASRVLGNGTSPTWIILAGAAFGLPGFAAIILSASGFGIPLFLAGTLATGFGAGLFGHATLTAAMRMAPAGQIGLALGAWGAVQATSAGIGIALGGIVRDVLLVLPVAGRFSMSTPYTFVFTIEIVFLAIAVLAALPLATRAQGRSEPKTGSRRVVDPRHNSVEVQ
jgi:BCD family chlorophyll transporter-like MFS transporter